MKVVTLVVTVLAAAFAAWVAGSWSVIAGAGALIMLGALCGRYVLPHADEVMARYVAAIEFNKLRQQWPIEKSLVFNVSGTLTLGGDLTVTVRVINAGSAAWTILGGTLARQSLVVSFGVTPVADLIAVVPVQASVVDQGQAVDVLFRGRVTIPPGVILTADQWRFGVLGTAEVPLIDAVAPEEPLTKRQAPVVNQSLMADGTICQNRIIFPVRILS